MCDSLFKQRIAVRFSYPFLFMPAGSPGIHDYRHLIELGPISITAARCVAWRALKRFNIALAIADYRAPRNATRSRNGNRPGPYSIFFSRSVTGKGLIVIHLYISVCLTVIGRLLYYTELTVALWSCLVIHGARPPAGSIIDWSSTI